MKHTLKFFLTVLIIGLIFSADSFAQGKGKGKNKHGKTIGPPPWAPANGYRKRFVYFPDYFCYYDCRKGLYLYFKNNSWITVSKLPLMFEKVDMKAVVKFELDLEDDVDYPQQFFEEHRKLYPKADK